MSQTDGADCHSDPSWSRTGSPGITEIVLCRDTTGILTMSGGNCYRSYCCSFPARFSLGVGINAWVSLVYTLSCLVICSGELLLHVLISLGAGNNAWVEHDHEIEYKPQFLLRYPCA